MAGSRSHIPPYFIMSFEVLAPICADTDDTADLPPLDTWMTFQVRVCVQPSSSCVPKWVIFHVLTLGFQEESVFYRMPSFLSSILVQAVRLLSIYSLLLIKKNKQTGHPLFVLSVKLLTMCDKQLQASFCNSEEPIAYRDLD